MDAQRVIRELDAIAESADYAKLETFLTENIHQARKEGDIRAQIMLQNEQIGLLRDLGRGKEAIQVFLQTRQLFEELDMVGTVPYATTLLNGANAYRACGRPEEALRLCQGVWEIYQNELPENDYRLASLYNNMSLAYMELGRNADALKALEKALAIIEKIPDTTVEQATTHTNLTDLYCREDDLAKANEHLKRGLALYDSIGCEDPHFPSLLSAWGQIFVKEGKLDEACGAYRRALTEIEKYYGKRRSYAIVCANCAVVLEQMGKTEEAGEMRSTAREILDRMETV